MLLQSWAAWGLAHNCSPSWTRPPWLYTQGSSANKVKPHFDISCLAKSWISWLWVPNTSIPTFFRADDRVLVNSKSFSAPCISMWSIDKLECIDVTSSNAAIATSTWLWSWESVRLTLICDPLFDRQSTLGKWAIPLWAPIACCFHSKHQNSPSRVKEKSW